MSAAVLAPATSVPTTVLSRWAAHRSGAAMTVTGVDTHDVFRKLVGIDRIGFEPNGTSRPLLVAQRDGETIAILGGA